MNSIYLKAGYDDMGKYGIPTDNSFIDENIAGKEVLIVSSPIRKTVKGSKKRFRNKVREFVLVTYNDKPLHIINSFKEIYQVPRMNVSL